MPVIVIAASFGAIPVLNIISHVLFRSIIGLVLLNPVLDLQQTFLHPCFDWPKKSFNENVYEELHRRGYFRLDGKIKIGQQLFREIQNVEPYKKLPEIRVPVLLIHGDVDRYVSYDISGECAGLIKKCDFITVSGADYGFENPQDEKIVINVVKRWVDELQSYLA